MRGGWYGTETDEICYQSGCTPTEWSDGRDEKYQVRIAAIVYLAQDRSNYTIWQLDINCASENCTRSSIFDDTKAAIQGTVADLTNFPSTRPPSTTPPPTTTTTLPANPLICYNCSCVGTTCPCNTTEIVSADRAYCTIIRRRSGQNVDIDYGYLLINPSYYVFREYPYLFNRESITYDELAGTWNTQPEYVIFGCDSSLCNSPEITPYIATSLVMRLSESWLNASVLGTGQPTRMCHQCENGTVCSNSSFIDADLCPDLPCNTTCLVSDRYNDPASGGQCYDSTCAPTDDQGFLVETHRVDIEGILYPSTPDRVDIREIDIYCRADNCSRPEVFEEIRNDITVITSDLSIIFNQTIEIRQLRCFNCSCSDISNCVCNTVSTFDATTTFCAIERFDNGTNVAISFTATEIGASYTNIREYPFVRTKESVLYNDQTGQWSRRTDELLFGCNWDYCNKASLANLLPADLNVSPPDVWLNSTLLGTGQSEFTCYNCSGSLCDTSSNIDVSSCSSDACNTTCFGQNTLSDSTANEECYQSYCVPEGSSSNQYRLEIQSIVYENASSTVEFWSIDIYCQVDNCSRPENFQGIKDNAATQARNLSTLFEQSRTDDVTQLSCYVCSCLNEPLCACDQIETKPVAGTYCTIIRLYQGQNVFLYLEHINRNSSGIYIQEFPYILVEESILYDETTGLWNTRPTLVTYGCSTSFCNDPNLIGSLPINFEMRLPEAWLNANILDAGQPIDRCHQCPNITECGTSDFIDISRCPPMPCNTTCFVADIFESPDSDEECYQSTCLTADADPEKLSGHRIEIEGIIYGNRPDPQLEFWVIEIYCRAVDCSRAEIFQELKAELDINIGDLSAFFNQTIIITKPTTIATTTTPAMIPLTCYDCFCFNNSACSCDTTITVNASSSYCTIIRQDYPEGFFIAVEPIRRNNTQVNIREFPFLLVEESIRYNENTTQWYTRNNLAIFGCSTDYCNHPSLVPYLPTSFQMTLPDVWLVANVLGDGRPVNSCHICPQGPQCSSLGFIDAGRCPIRPCNTTCVLSDVYDIIDDQQCYESSCASADSGSIQTDPARVDLEGILYLYPPGREVELWEVDILCRAFDCSRPEIFGEVSL